MSSKRRAGEQVTRENLHEFENEEDEVPIGPSRASAEVLAKRKILKPRGRLAGRTGTGAPPSTASGAPGAAAPSSSGFGFSFGKPATSSSSGGEDKPANPFSAFGSSTSSTTADKPAFSFGTTSAPAFKAPEAKSEESKSQAVFSFINNQSKENNSTSLVSTKNTDKPHKIKALNDTFYEKITQERGSNPVANFTPILRKYIDYYDRIENDLDIPDADQIEEKDEQKALPAPETKQQTFNFGAAAKPTFSLPSTSNTAPASTPSFSFGQKKAEEDSKTAEKKEESPDVIDVDSDDSDDSIKIEGPTFNVEKPISTSDGVFKLSKDAPQTSAPSSTGPTFSFTATTSKNFDSPFMLKPVEKKEEAAEEKKEEPKKAFNLEGSSSNNFTWSPGKPINLSNDEGKPALPFSFGQKADDKKDNPTKPTFTFGKPAEEKKDESAKPAFSFGLNASTSTSTSTEAPKSAFTFGSTSASSTESAAKPAFTFGQNNGSTGSTFGSSSQFSFNFNKSASATPAPTTESKNDDGDEKVEEAEVKGDFKVAELKDKVEEKTGEEDEELLYTKRAKIQLFNTETKGYESKGLGDLKVLKHKETNKSRILVRADGSNRVILNIAVVKSFKYETIGKGNMVRIPAANGSKIETYLAQVKTPEDGNNLLSALKDAQSALE